MPLKQKKPADPPFTEAFTEDAKAFLRAHKNMALIDEGGVRSALLADFGLDATGNWASPLGTIGMEQLQAIRERKPPGSVVLTDTTGLLTAAAITLPSADQHTPPATALSLLDLASILNAVVFHDHVLYLGPIDALGRDDIGEYLNELLAERVFVAVTDPDTPADDAEGLVFGELFVEAAASLARIFVPDPNYAPNVSKLELDEVVAAWSKLLRRPADSFGPWELYDADVATHHWRSRTSGYGHWLIKRLATHDGADAAAFDLERFISWLGAEGLGRAVTEVHLRSLFNSVLAYKVLECPYRATAMRQPWSNLFANRADAVARSLLVEGLFEEVVRRRRTQFQLPSKAVLRLPSVLSLALRDARIPADVWRIAGRLRAELAPFRRKQADLIRVLTEGDDVHDQSYARGLLQALQDGMPQTLADNVAVGVTVTMSVLPKLVAAPTGAGVIDLLATLNSAASSSGILQRIVRRLFQPELQVLSRLSTDAGAALGAMRHAERLWKLNEPAAKGIEEGLRNLAA